MELMRRSPAMTEIARQARARGRRIGLVPTMGALHDGHLALVRAARERTDLCVVSIFVNPTQFGPHEDFASYPRDLVKDADVCIGAGVDHVFAPPLEDLYPPGARTWVEVEGPSSRLEGASRPGHFRGVATVVLKLLHVIQPHVAVFGQKDAQQAWIVRRMVEDLRVDAEIVTVPTVRDADGLALSSRHAYLSADERAAARAIPRALAAAGEARGAPGATVDSVAAAAHSVLAAEPGIRVDYVEIVDADTFEPATSLDGPRILVVAAHAGRTRLIDNAAL
jgi:pantoate--beta-alanine ligase